MPNGALCLADAGLEVHKAAGSASCANGASATPDWRWLGAKGGATCTGRGRHPRWRTEAVAVELEGCERAHAPERLGGGEADDGRVELRQPWQSCELQGVYSAVAEAGVRVDAEGGELLQAGEALAWAATIPIARLQAIGVDQQRLESRPSRKAADRSNLVAVELELAQVGQGGQGLDGGEGVEREVEGPQSYAAATWAGER